MFLLECPRCKNRMKYQPMSKSKLADVSKKVKRCVYCGFSMSTTKAFVKEL